MLSHNWLLKQLACDHSQNIADVATSGSPRPTPRAIPKAAEGRPDKAARRQDRERRKERDRVARRIAKLEERIGEDEARKKVVTARLAEPEVYATPARVQEVQAEEAEIEAEIAAGYEEWEKLSEHLAELEAD